MSTSATLPALPRRRALGLLSAAAGAPLLPILSAGHAQAATNPNQQGIGGAWYNPLTPGQGLVIEAYPHLLGAGLGLLFAGWYTYVDTAGGANSQRWYSLSGDITAGVAQVPVTIYQNTGGQFNTAPATFAQRVGSGTLHFDSCSSGRLDYAFDAGPSGSIPLARLMQNVVCSEGGTGVDSDLALSGAWYDPASAGQGLVVDINPVSGAAFAGWYTYAPAGSADAGAAGQRWYSLQGSYQRAQTTVACTLYRSTGGVFDNASVVDTVAVGTAELVYLSCTSARLDWRFSAGELAGQSGSISLSRTGPSPGACAFASTCALIPSETEGPYPLLSILANPAIVRQDITEGRPGVPLTLVLKLVNINQGCAPIANAALYIWQCDKDGVYSGYSGQTGGTNATGQSFMRGVQTTDSGGQAVFQTIYPGWYAGRITHIHFRAYLNNTLSGNGAVTSQLAFPQDVTQAVYGSNLYAARGQNTSVTSFAADNVFRDGTQFQMVSISGNPVVGYIATLIVGIAA